MSRFAVIAGGRSGAEPAGPSSRPAPERGGLEELYRRHAAAVYARCRYLLRDDDAARDATQDVFVRVLRAGDGRGAEPLPTAFLLRAATNHCLNVLRAGRAGGRQELARLGRERTVRGVEPDARELVRRRPGEPARDRLLSLR